MWFSGLYAPGVNQLQANLITPGLNVRPEGGGRLLLQCPDLDSFANPANPAPVDSYIGEEMHKRLRKLFNNMEMAQLERIAVGQRSDRQMVFQGLVISLVSDESTSW